MPRDSITTNKSSTTTRCHNPGHPAPKQKKKHSLRSHYQRADDVWKKDVWGAFPDIFRTAISLGNEGKDGKNLSSQTWPGSPRRPSPRHPRPPDTKVLKMRKLLNHVFLKALHFQFANHESCNCICRNLLQIPERIYSCNCTDA